MAKLSWVTDTKKAIANLLIGVNSEIQLLVEDSEYTGETITFTKVLGDLPPGITLSSNGVISGIPVYSTPFNNYFVTQEYTFHIQAKGETGAAITDYFKIIITNTVNGDFAWVTPAGRLGTAPNNEFYSLRLVASGVSGSPITYSFVSGELPDGMQLLPTGYLQGVPTFLNPIAVNQSQTYRFTIRASTNQGHIIDRSFSLDVTNVLGPVIQPESKAPYFLGTFFDGAYYNRQLNVTEINPAVELQWSIIDAEKNPLPDGLTLGQDGVISGIIQPLQLDGVYGPSGYSGANVSVVGEVVSSGSFVKNQAYIINTVGSTDFTSIGATQNLSGVEFIATSAGTGTGTAFFSNTAVVTSSQAYSYGPYDFNRVNQNVNYSFTVQAFDGANYDLQEYTMEIVSRSSFTADSTNFVNDTYLTVDTTNQNIPFLVTTGSLPVARQNSYFAFKFEGVDLQNDQITYSLANTAGTFDSEPFDPLERDDFNNGLTGSFDSNDPEQSATNNLPGILLDADTGWLYGKIDPQAESSATYTFGVVVSKVVDTITLSSVPRYFTLTVLGDINNIVEWITPTNLGIINNGTVSELSVQAKSIVGKPLVYTLVDQANLSAGLPQGLTILPSGDISGRVSFEVFTIDHATTTFDKTLTTVDRTYSFTVKAETEDGTASATREFTMSLNQINVEPYENLYLRAMPAHDQRQIYNSIVSNTDIFDPAIIYRPTDPWFGVRKNIETLFLPGLTAETLNAYQTAIEKNHWRKTYNFGDISTAVVLDEFYNIKYEVVYIDINDPAENVNNRGASLEVDLTGVITNPYKDASGTEYTVVYPNSNENMINRLEAGVGYSDQSSLPPWMTSNQPDPTAPTKFKTPLGYVKAVVLAYTVPGAAKLIAYRLKTAGINFNNIEFTADRYRVDDFYSRYFDPSTRTYIKSNETTFDYLPSTGVGQLVARVNYATNSSFAEINGRSVSYIIQHGTIDGIVKFEAGQTLIFAKQEGFINPGPYNGWVKYTNAYIGDDITTSVTEGYDSTGYDTYTVIPGYLEKVQGIATENQRGGVWQINIVNGIVFLTPVQEIAPNNRVQVINGKSFSGAILYYDPVLRSGQTVPSYRQFDASRFVVGAQTTFNGGSTKFISNRDQYYAPGSQDKYLSFPQYGVFK